MKIIIAMDSFKGSLTAAEASEAAARGILRVLPAAQVIRMPVADGGEGTLDAIVAATGGRKISLMVMGPLGDPVEASYGLLGPGNESAVVEMAQAAGLGLVAADRRDPRRTTTYGVGELLLAAAQSGAKQIIVGLGGSATNDGGAGAVQALGTRFFDSENRLMPAGIGGAALARLARIDISAFRFSTETIEVTIASDVTNPLLGPNGASAIYGPQKGADETMVAELDAALSHYASVLKRDIGKDVAMLPGAGAAGGLGGGLMAFLGAKAESGIGLVLDTIGFDTQARDADYVFTGEGKIDLQTAQGKVISGIMERCVNCGVPVIAFGGSIDDPALEPLYARGLKAAFPIMSSCITLEQAMRDGARLLEDAAARVARLLPIRAERSSGSAPRLHGRREM
jgi:glycerate kinase